jgi:hypothetical protein
MRSSRALRAAVCVVCLAGTGCTTLREVPRSQYSSRSERQNVRVITREGLHYEFDYARFTADTLIGYRERDVSGRFSEFASLHVPLEEVSRLSIRQIDWSKTSWIGGGVIAGVVAAGLATSTKQDDPERTPGTGTIRPPN